MMKPTFSSRLLLYHFHIHVINRPYKTLGQACDPYLFCHQTWSSQYLRQGGIASNPTSSFSCKLY